MAMDLLEVLFYLQAFVTILAVICNMFLVFIVIRYTKNKIGNYKYLIITFSCFETLYALFVFVGMPTHFMADRSWLVFSHGGFIGDTRFAVLGPGFYCTFYEIWVGLVVLHFLYRYIILCRENWIITMQKYNSLKLALICLYFGQVLYSAICGFYFCTRERMLPVLAEKVKAQFGIEDPYSIGYILLRTRQVDGSLSPAGLTTILNHYVLVGFSVAIIVYCGVSIWRAIQRMQRDSTFLREVRIQRQMFFTLVTQTTVPIIFCHIPTAIYLTFPFWESDFSLGSLSPIFSLLTSVNKFVDPLIVMFCITDYRRAALRILCGRSSGIIGLSSSSDEAHRGPTGSTTGVTTPVAPSSHIRDY